MPEWAVASFAAAFGEDWIGQLQALAERPPLDLRVNTAEGDAREGAQGSRRATVPSRRRSPGNGVRIAAGAGPARLPNVTAEPAFAKGWFEVQDEGSQIVADLVMAEAGEQVLDLCAGGGGKTLAMSAAMENKGKVHAFDADRKRLAPIFERLKRAGTRNVQVHEDRDALETLAEPLRPRPRRRAVHGHGHVAPPTGRQVAAFAGESRGAHGGAGCGARRGGPLRAAGRPARLCHLLAAAGGKRGHGSAGFPGRPTPEFELEPAVESWERLFGATDREALSRPTA